MTCLMCGKKTKSNTVGLFCSSKCITEYENTQEEEQDDKQKYEEIKQIALGVFVHNNCCIDSAGAWEEAEKFYKYAKEKQEENL